MIFLDLTRWLFAHSRLAWAFLMGIFAFFVLGLVQLEVNLSFDAFIGSRSAKAMALEKHLELWGNADRFAVVVVKPTEKGGLLSKKSIAAQQQSVLALERLSDVKRVLALPTLPLIGHERAFSAPTLVELSKTKNVLELKEIVVKNAILKPRFLAADESSAAYFLELTLDSDDVQAFGAPIARIRRELRVLEEKFQLKFILAGVPAIRADFVQLLIHDQGVFVVVALLLCLGLVAFFFRSIHGVFIPIVLAIVPAVELFGFMGWMHEPVGILSQVFATLIPVIAIADAVHVLTRFHQGAIEKFDDKIEGQSKENWNGVFNDDKKKNALIAEVMYHVGAACFLTSVTTAVGFLSLTMADMKVLIHFGLYAGVGVLLSFLNFIFLAPLLLRRTKRISLRLQKKSKIKTFLKVIVRFSLRNPVLVVGLGLIWAVFSIKAAQNVNIDNRLHDVLGVEHPVTKANQEIDEKLSGVVSIHLDVESDDSLHTLEFLQAFDVFEKWAKTLPEVRCLEGPGSRVRTATRLVVGSSSLPKTNAELAQVLFLVEGNLPFDDVLSADGLHGRVVLHISDLGGIAAEELGRRLEEGASRIFDSRRLKWSVTGMSYMAYLSFNRISSELAKSLLSALLFILVLIALLFRKLSWGILALVPNVLPLVATLGIMGVLQWRLDPPSSIVFVVGFGIAVDDTIHILARIQQELRAGYSLNNAIEQSVLSTGKAVTMTSIVLMVGFGINGFSSFPMNAVFGILGALLVGFAWICDVFLLPAFWALQSKLGKNNRVTL